MKNLKEVNDEELREIKNHLLWNRGSTRQILQLSDEQFRRMVASGLVVAAHVMRASDRYSLVKQYGGWRLPIGAWHLWCAAGSAHEADSLTDYRPASLTLGQIDVITRIFSKVPIYRSRARTILEFALYSHPDRHSMKPHTRALMLITLGDLELKRGMRDRARDLFTEAEELLSDIESEDSPDREEQLVRVKKSIALFHYDNGNYLERRCAVEMLEEAHLLASRVAKDQQLHIETECRKRGIELE